MKETDPRKCARCGNTFYGNTTAKYCQPCWSPHQKEYARLTGIGGRATKKFREKNKDKLICIVCGEKEKGFYSYKDPSNIEIHHIDNDKLNNEESNFMILCRRCHRGLHYHPGRKDIEKKYAKNI